MNIAQIYSHYLECGGRVSIDSRQIEGGELFIAIRGERFDGNKFVAEVLAKGASHAIVDDKSAHKEGKTTLVPDTLKALQALAKHHRSTLDFPIIGITGSNGKTTTKELLNEVLKTKYAVYATQGNFNNHIGVPLTLLAIPNDTEIAIIEMGANHVGEIAELCTYADPTHGLITNIGRAHLEGFGSLEGIIEGKTELYKHLAKRQGLIFYNNQDKVLSGQLANGYKTKPYVKWLEVETQAHFLKVQDPQTGEMLQSQLVGRYNDINMRSAATVAEHFNVSKTDIVKALASYSPQNNRSQIVEKNGYQLILDAYNANPSSMVESIGSFAELHTRKEKILILGDMAELGAREVELHREILDYLTMTKWYKVILVGQRFSKADSARAHLQYNSVDELIKKGKSIKEMMQGRICLIKASRSMKLEKLETLIS